MVNLDNDLLWRAALSGWAASAEGKPPVIVNVERQRNHTMGVLKGAIQHVLADDLGPLLKKKGISPGARDLMRESVVSMATAALQMEQDRARGHERS